MPPRLVAIVRWMPTLLCRRRAAVEFDDVAGDLLVRCERQIELVVDPLGDRAAIADSGSSATQVRRSLPASVRNVALERNWAARTLALSNRISRELFAGKSPAETVSVNVEATNSNASATHHRRQSFCIMIT